MRDTTSHTQPKVVVSDPTFLDDYFQTKNLRYQLISWKDIDDQIMLQSDWLRVF